MVRLSRRIVPVLCLLFGAVANGQQPLPPDQQAEQQLNAARKIYNEGNLPAAQQQFQQILQKFANTPQANGARFGIALCLLNSAEPDYLKAIENLTGPANDGGFVDRAMASYQLATAQRFLALKESAKPSPNAGEVTQRYNEARRWFDVARDVYQQKKDDDLSGRSRCDMAEIEIRLGRLNEARGVLEPFIKDSNFSKSKARPLALYYHGLASFLLKDYPLAGRSLNQLAPFNDPAFGLHAEYLVGRVLHLSGEKAEASVHYDAVLANFTKQKTEAATQLQQPDRFKNNPYEKARLQALATGPVPEYIAGSAFHGASLNYEAGKFAESLTKFQTFIKDHPASALLPDATLRIGFCLVQMKQFEEAAKALQPLLEKTPRLADQAGFWLGKAQLGQAQAVEATNLAERENKSKAAIATMKAAADKANQFAQNDADAKFRRQEMLVDLADAMQLVKQYKEAAQIYEQLWNEQALPLRREELLQRLATAAGSAGELDRSNQRCDEFRRVFPQSVLLPSVLYRQAENSFARTTELAKDRNRAAELKTRYEESIVKFKEVVDKFPEFERVNYARFSLAVCLTQLGNLEEAVKVFDAIPGPDRAGELSIASYMQADCLIRLAPTKAEDALQENQIREKLTAAAGQLESFVASNPKAPETAAALLKLGYCTKRLGSTLADQNERNQTLNRAREIYEKLARDHKGDPLSGQGVLEMAKVKALMGDIGGAQNDLRQFSQNQELAKTPIAPLAALQLATLFRQQNNPTEAGKVLEQARQRYEQDLAKDPERKEWADLLKYHHGLAIYEQNKPTEARPLFEQLVQTSFSTAVGAEAALRLGQASISEARKKLDQSYEARNQAGNNAQKRQQAEQQIQQARQAINQSATILIQRGDASRNVLANAEPRARMYYDAAWAWRFLADDEVTKAREELQKQLRQKAHEELVKKLPAGQEAPKVESLPLPEVSRNQIPPQPSEDLAIAAYRKQIEEFTDSALSVDARQELAELLATRNQTDEIIKILREAIDKETTDRPVSTDTLERVRLRLGASLYSKKDYAAAAAQFDAVASNAKSPYLGQAFYRAGECYVALGNFAKAIEKLSIFRDKGEFHNRDGISDRAMLRLGQALTGAKQFEPARQAFETMIQRFGNGNPLSIDARYGIALSWQNQNRFDEAIASYQQVIAATQGETAAKAVVQVGQCQLAQRKFSEAAGTFLSVAYTYDQFPEIGYAAALEAARAYIEDKKPDAAEKVLRKLLKDVPKDSEWAKAAAERLEQLKK
jgi:cellulose synthase operon protein C